MDSITNRERLADLAALDQSEARLIEIERTSAHSAAKCLIAAIAAEAAGDKETAERADRIGARWLELSVRARDQLRDTRELMERVEEEPHGLDRDHEGRSGGARDSGPVGTVLRKTPAPMTCDKCGRETGFLEYCRNCDSLLRLSVKLACLLVILAAWGAVVVVIVKMWGMK